MSLDIQGIQYEWISILDKNTCDDCAELDGEVFDKDDLPDFPQHANCQCDLIPVIDDNEE